MVRPPKAICPILDSQEARCADRLTLPNLSSAFGLCAGQYVRCPTYLEIRLERAMERSGHRQRLST